MSQQDDEKRELSEEEEDSLLETIVGLIDIPMLLLALVSLALIVVEFTVHLTRDQSRSVSFIQTLIWAVFLLEFALRVFLAEKRIRYLKRHWFDALIVFIPALRVLRIFRAVRAIRLLRVIHPSALARTFFTTRRTLNNLGRTLGKSSFPYVLLTTAIVLLLGGAGMLLLERNAGGSNIRSYGDALWYVTGLVTTIGTELYPVTTEGRILSALLMVYGVGIFGYLAGTLASYFVQTNVQPQIPTLPAETEGKTGEE